MLPNFIWFKIRVDQPQISHLKSNNTPFLKTFHNFTNLKYIYVRSMAFQTLILRGLFTSLTVALANTTNNQHQGCLVLNMCATHTPYLACNPNLIRATLLAVEFWDIRLTLGIFTHASAYCYSPSWHWAGTSGLPEHLPDQHTLHSCPTPCLSKTNSLHI